MQAFKPFELQRQL